jgi:hypothetical protein
MLAIDLRNAFEGADADNFTVILLRLIAKSDSENKAKLALGYPVAVKAVEIYKNDCPYTDEDKSRVDWDKIAEMAEEAVYPEGKITPDDEGELQIRIGDVKGQIVLDFGKPVTWIGFPPMMAMNLAENIIRRVKALVVKG